jgi:hypothetical protein
MQVNLFANKSVLVLRMRKSFDTFQFALIGLATKKCKKQFFLIKASLS